MKVKNHSGHLINIDKDLDKEKQMRKTFKLWKMPESVYSVKLIAPQCEENIPTILNIQSRALTVCVGAAR